MRSENYRAEIDGLRSIAVLVVILYHAEFVIFGRDWFKGGFLGVDIFFVISGYLITRIILSELFSKGKFSYLNFYERRARRILPMLFTVILVSLPFAWEKLLPADLIEYSESVITSIFFSSNFFFYFTTTEYGADSSLLKPFLHTWSLGVEEQYYIVFPVLLIVFYKLWNKHILGALLTIFLLSMLFASIMSETDKELNFYLPFSRFWELLSGSFLAYSELRYGRFKNDLLSGILPVTGLMIIIFSVLSFDNNTPHPGIYTLMPIIGVSLIIGFSSSKDFTGKLLGSKPFVGVGLISYSAYLWHFPIMAFGRVGKNTISNYDKFEWILLTLVLSFVSYFVIEKPFRNKLFIKAKYFYLTILSIVVLLIAAFLIVLKEDGYPQRIPPILQESVYSKNTWSFLQQDGKNCHNRKDDFCAFTVSDSDISVYAFGDSHFSSLSMDLLERIKGDFNYTEANLFGCPYVSGVTRLDEHGSIDENCNEDIQKKRTALILNDRPSVILVGGRFPLYLEEYYFDNKEGGVEKKGKYFGSFLASDGKTFEAKVRETYLKLLEQGHHIIIVYPIPEVGWNVPKQLMKKLPKTKDLNQEKTYLMKHPLTTSSSVYFERSQSSFKLFDSIEHPNLHKVFPHLLFCDRQVEGRCVTHDLDHVFYSDDDHPSRKGSEMINSLIIAEIHKIKNLLNTLE